MNQTNTDDESLPIIDLSKSKNEIAMEIRNACSEFGFFYIINHGIEDTMTSQAFDKMKEFFNLEYEKKMKIKVSEQYRGYEPSHKLEYGEQKCQNLPLNQQKKKESFYMGRKDIQEICGPMQGPNQWVEENILPQFRTIFEQYFQQMWALGDTLTDYLALSLELEEDYFRSLDAFKEPLLMLRLLRYDNNTSACTTNTNTNTNKNVGKDDDDDKSGSISSSDSTLKESILLTCKEHTDYGMLTILALDNVPGLQIFLNEKWINIPPIKGAFVCNLGDMIQTWTKTFYKSTLHRVINNSNHPCRYSLPFFYEPNPEYNVIPIPNLPGIKNDNSNSNKGDNSATVNYGSHVQNILNEKEKQAKELETLLMLTAKDEIKL